MFGEKPVRHSVTPISSAMDRKRFLKISNSTGWIVPRPGSGSSGRCQADVGIRPGPGLGLMPGACLPISTFPCPSTLNRQPGGTTMVASPPVMIAGPRAWEPGGQSVPAVERASAHRVRRSAPARTAAGRGAVRRRIRVNGSDGFVGQAGRADADRHDFGRPRPDRHSRTAVRGDDRTPTGSPCEIGTVISYDCPT